METFTAKFGVCEELTGNCSFKFGNVLPLTTQDEYIRFALQWNDALDYEVLDSYPRLFLSCGNEYMKCRYHNDLESKDIIIEDNEMIIPLKSHDNQQCCYKGLFPVQLFLKKCFGNCFSNGKIPPVLLNELNFFKLILLDQTDRQLGNYDITLLFKSTFLSQLQSIDLYKPHWKDYIDVELDTSVSYSDECRKYIKYIIFPKTDRLIMKVYEAVHTESIYEIDIFSIYRKFSYHLQYNKIVISKIILIIPNLFIVTKSHILYCQLRKNSYVHCSWNAQRDIFGATAFCHENIKFFSHFEHRLLTTYRLPEMVQISAGNEIPWNYIFVASIYISSYMIVVFRDSQISYVNNYVVVQYRLETTKDKHKQLIFLHERFMPTNNTITSMCVHPLSKDIYLYGNSIYISHDNGINFDEFWSSPKYPIKYCLIDTTDIIVFIDTRNVSWFTRSASKHIIPIETDEDHIMMLETMNSQLISLDHVNGDIEGRTLYFDTTLNIFPKLLDLNLSYQFGLSLVESGILELRQFNFDQTTDQQLYEDNHYYINDLGYAVVKKKIMKFNEISYRLEMFHILLNTKFKKIKLTIKFEPLNMLICESDCFNEDTDINSSLFTLTPLPIMISITEINDKRSAKFTLSQYLPKYKKDVIIHQWTLLHLDLYTSYISQAYCSEFTHQLLTDVTQDEIDYIQSYGLLYQRHSFSKNNNELIDLLWEHINKNLEYPQMFQEEYYEYLRSILNERENLKNLIPSFFQFIHFPSYYKASHLLTIELHKKQNNLKSKNIRLYIKSKMDCSISTHVSTAKTGTWKSHIAISNCYTNDSISTLSVVNLASNLFCPISSVVINLAIHCDNFHRFFLRLSEKINYYNLHLNYDARKFDEIHPINNYHKFLQPTNRIYNDKNENNCDYLLKHWTFKNGKSFRFYMSDIITCITTVPLLIYPQQLNLQFVYANPGMIWKDAVVSASVKLWEKKNSYVYETVKNLVTNLRKSFFSKRDNNFIHLTQEKKVAHKIIKTGPLEFKGLMKIREINGRQTFQIKHNKDFHRNGTGYFIANDANIKFLSTGLYHFEFETVEVECKRRTFLAIYVGESALSFEEYFTINGWIVLSFATIIFLYLFFRWISSQSKLLIKHPPFPCMQWKKVKHE
ncbi:hypothetical protein SNEBB_009336 [Seison nebaliae]|nr:hypothetical protein SNEBB_009336 [Seison nebaliae]